MRRRAPGPAISNGPRRVVVAVLAIVATALTGALAEAPAQAAGPKYPRVITIAASADYLVYRQQTTNAYGLSFSKGSALYFIGRHGGRHALTDFDPERAQSLQGSMLVQADAYQVADDPAQPEQVRWRDLRTGRAGVAELPASDDLAGAAPGGWIATRRVGAEVRVIRYRATGATTDLGSPLPGAAPTRVTIGPLGLVVAAVNTRSDRFDEASDSSGWIRYLEFRHPDAWHTVYRAGAGVNTSCSGPSSSHVVCSVERATGKHSGTVLLSLHSARRVWVDDHPSTCPVISFVTVGSTAVGKATSTQRHCVRGRLTQFDASGRFTTPKRTWGAHSSYLTPGFGGILLDTGDQRRIVRIATVSGAARTVVTAH